MTFRVKVAEVLRTISVASTRVPMILMRIFVLFSITYWLGSGKATWKVGMGRKGHFWRAYLVLGSVGWWVRRWIKLEVGVEELKSSPKQKSGACGEGSWNLTKR